MVIQQKIATGLTAVILGLSAMQSNAQISRSYVPPKITTLSAQDYLNLIESKKKLSDFYAFQVNNIPCPSGFYGYENNLYNYLHPLQDSKQTREVVRYFDQVTQSNILSLLSSLTKNRKSKLRVFKLPVHMDITTRASRFFIDLFSQHVFFH